MKEFGTFFANKYIPELKETADDLTTERAFWRCSKAGRARDSGIALIAGFNEAAEIEMFKSPVNYDIDADNFFRPWKIYKPVVDGIKSKADSDPIWIAKAEENYEMLKRVYSALGIQEKIISKPVKCLWSTTYISCLIAVEAYWPKENDKRCAITEIVSTLNPEDVSQIKSLSLWVWQQRFIDCDEYPLFGGRLTSEMLERCLDDSYRVNVYSAHDYTVLSALSALRIYPEYEEMLNFACTLVIEVWSGVPPPHLTSGPARRPLGHEKTCIDNVVELFTGPAHVEGKVVRLLLNTNPFRDPMVSTLQPVPSANTACEIVLAEYTEAQVREKIRTIRSLFDTVSATAPMTEVRSGTGMDEDGE